MFIGLCVFSLVLSACVSSLEGLDPLLECHEPPNFVDERYELVSLVFRLAGVYSHRTVSTVYQGKLNNQFSEFRNHPVVNYTTHNLHFGYDAVLNMAIHLEKADGRFALKDNINFLVAPLSGLTRWTDENATEFVELLNDFYIETDFAAFYLEHTDYYLDHTARFINEVYGAVNHEWFRRHGLNPDNLRAIVAPSDSRNAYASWLLGETLYDTVVYAVLPGAAYYGRFHPTVIHEYSHFIANPTADKWYAENEVFRKWSDDSVDLERLPTYSNGQIIAAEYVTRAYTILYMVENTGADPKRLMLNEIAMGFPYIEEVYAMIYSTEPSSDPFYP